MTKLTALLLTILLFGCTREPSSKIDIRKLGRVEDDPEMVKKIPLVTSGNLNTVTTLLPSSFFIVTPPIGNQMSEGACVAFATSVARSIQWYYKTNATSFNQSTNIFSAEYLYNTCKITGDCYAGSSITGCLNWIYNYGICRWSVMPQVDGDCVTLPNAAQQADALNYKIATYNKFISADILALKQSIYGKNPVILPINIDNAFLNCGAGFIWSPATISDGQAPHAVVLVGWDDSKHAFKVQNSFGTSWGDAGFGWIDYDLFSNNLKIGYYSYGNIDMVAPPPPPAETYSISVTKKTVKGKVNDIIAWNTALNNAPQSAQLQVAADTVNFATFYAINPFTATGNYTYIPTIKTTRYYRLKIVRSDLSIVYSSIVSIL